MYRVTHSEAPKTGSLRFLSSSVVIATTALMLSACSSDVSRFDFPTFGLNGSSDKSSDKIAEAAPRPSQPVYSYRPDTPKWGATNDFGDQPLPSNGRAAMDRSNDVRVAELAPTQAQPDPYARPADNYRPRATSTSASL